MKLPEKIDPDPIQEALVEVRFDASTPDEAVFGLIYEALKGRYPRSEQFNILQLPDVVRRQDPSLRYKPHYRLSDEDSEYVVHVGPKVVTVVVTKPYPGWAGFSEEVLRIFRAVQGTEIIDSVTRLGLRYLNFFEADIFGKIELELQLRGKSVVGNETQVRTVVTESQRRCILQVNNTSTLTDRATGKTKSGSLIDVDVIYEDVEKEFFSHAESLIEESHEIEKKLFFRLLNEEFLESLNPVYS